MKIFRETHSQIQEERFMLDQKRRRRREEEVEEVKVERRGENDELECVFISFL